jgi:hypothetical protein
VCILCHDRELLMFFFGDYGNQYLATIFQALVSWFYKGQIEIDELLQCRSVSEAVQIVISGGSLGE